MANFFFSLKLYDMRKNFVYYYLVYCYFRCVFGETPVFLKIATLCLYFTTCVNTLCFHFTAGFKIELGTDQDANVLGQ